MAKLVCVLGLAAALLIAPAQADAVRGKGYSAVFPCSVKLTGQQVAAGKKTIPVIDASCEAGEALFFVAASTYPKGFIAKKTLVGAFKDAVAGAAANVKGTVRLDRPIKMGRTPGHDVMIDVPSGKMAAHLRVFFVGDMQYQVMVVGPRGSESAKPATDFLASFKLGK